MGKRKKKSVGDYMPMPTLDIDPEIKKGIFIIFMLSFGAISILSLFGMAGMLGSYIEYGMRLVFGWGKWFFPLTMIVLGYFLYNEEKYEIRARNYIGLALLFLSTHGLFEIFFDQAEWPAILPQGQGGGYIGMFVAGSLVRYLGFWGGLILVISLVVVSLMLMLNKNLIELFGPESLLAKVLFPFSWLISKVFRQEEEADEEDQEEENEENDEESEEEHNEDENEDSSTDSGRGDDEDTDEGEDEEPKEKKFTMKKVKAAPALEEDEPKKGAKIKHDLETWWSNPIGIRVDLPFNLLNDKKGKPVGGDVKERQETIKHTLEKFNIAVDMDAYSVGPTVTQFTFKPAEGVKLSRITTLSNDLALSLAAHPIRIEAPIPGKSLVGVEVPNETKANVGLREILKADEFADRKSDLMMALGKDVAGKAWLYDLARMPHVLVAGATNSGKSVCLNALIISLIYQNSPDNLRFIMIDPKRVELVNYNELPYLMCPVITDVPGTVNALKWCINEMETRFEILSKYKKRNIQSYNEAAKVKMPYVVVVIDELADLMVVAGKDIEAGIIRLAQKARAVGIHLILATQRPSVDVITGLIKANMPSRVAFSVASAIDSKTILDTAGAEKLLGRGDMLFSTAEISKPVRIQGCFVSDDEINKIVKFIKSRFNSETRYVDEITAKQKVRGMGGSNNDEDDDLYDEAKSVVIETGKASTSFLQRKFSIGYSRAAKLIDMMESDGIVGPANGSKPREILISKDELNDMQSGGMSAMPLHNRDEAEAPDSYLGQDEDDDDSSSDDGQTEPEDDEEDENEDDEEVDDENDDGENEDDGNDEGEESGEDDEEEVDDNDDEPELDDEEEEDEPKIRKSPKDISERLFSR